ncbi:30S ribosomal protein S5 [Patescibacteria group bacterium]|nr:30S ribosomal protein S5 [Patescibacteria group bacterium]
MADDKKTVETSSLDQQAAAVVAKTVYGGQDKRSSGGARSPRRDNRGKRDERRDEFEQRILEIARVTRVMAGGKRMNFRACVAIGDRKGSVGVGLGKGADVTMAVNKAVNRAKKTLVKVPVLNDTIPHMVLQKLGAASIIFKPAKQGRGVISGGVTRAILELAGVKNVSSKVLGSNNKVNNARCTLAALASLRQVDGRKSKKENSKINDKVVKSKEKEVNKTEPKTNDKKIAAKK